MDIPFSHISFDDVSAEYILISGKFIPKMAELKKYTHTCGYSYYAELFSSYYYQVHNIRIYRYICIYTHIIVHVLQPLYQLSVIF